MLSSMLPVLSLLYSTALALNPVLVKDNVFYDSVTKQRMFLIGVDYQPLGEQGIDPLVDPEVCARDLFLIQKMGANVVRVYTVDNTKDHDECLSMYNAGGIYLLLDVNSGKPNEHLNRLEPWTTYTKAYAEHVFKTITVFSGYDNVIGFFSGNELINGGQAATTSPPYIKAITRDMKAYIGKHLNRPFAIGYSAADNIEYRVETANYMSCGGANDGRNDFYAINSYQWCGPQTIHSSGYDTLISQFQNFTLPLFFSELGCNRVKPRQFQEVGAIFSDAMTSVFSGLIMYEYSQEPNDYGLVKIDTDGSVTELADYDTLSSKFTSIKDLPVDMPTTTLSVPDCKDLSFTSINGSLTLPSLPEIEKLIEDGVVATPGKLSEITLRATKYTIKDTEGNEITDKTPTKKSGVSGVDLKSQLTGWAPTQTGSDTSDSSDGSSDSSSSSKSSGNSTSDDSKSAGTTLMYGKTVIDSVFGIVMAAIVLLVIV